MLLNAVTLRIKNLTGSILLYGIDQNGKWPKSLSINAAVQTVADITASLSINVLSAGFL
jgi:hypothetical protein